MRTSTRQLLVQCELSQGVRRTVAWLPLQPKLQVGTAVKHADGIWQVDRVYRLARIDADR